MNSTPFRTKAPEKINESIELQFIKTSWNNDPSLERQGFLKRELQPSIVIITSNFS